MDIDLLSKMVKELILDHDRVALPGLGVFVAETVPASFSDKGYTVNPPYRRLYFRSGNEDDGLLASLYASENGVGLDIASAAVADFVSGMKEVLEKKKNMVFPGLGRLRATKENNFFFVADEDLDIYPDGFALEPVSLKTHVETKEEVSSALDVLKDMIVEPAEEPEKVAEEADVTEDSAEVPSGGTGEQAAVEKDAGQEITAAENKVTAGEDTGTMKHEAAPVKKNRLLYGLLIGLAVLVLVTVLYMVVARIFPEAVDSILYSPEEYDILHGH